MFFLQDNVHVVVYTRLCTRHLLSKYGSSKYKYNSIIFITQVLLYIRYIATSIFDKVNKRTKTY